MALRRLDQAALLVVRLWRRPDGRDAFPRWHSPGKQSYLRGRSVSGMLLTIAHAIFAFHFGLMLFGLGRTASMPTFLNPQEEEAVKDHI